MLRDLNTGVETRVPADGLAILIGQKPHTEWADGLLARDGQGFLLTGPDLPGRASAAVAAPRAASRPPQLPCGLATDPRATLPGDERTGCVRRGRRTPWHAQAHRLSSR